MTRNRSGVLRETLLAIRDQRSAPASVLVVDNDSRDGTAAMLREQFPEVGYHRLPENLGFGAGLAVGMAEAAARGGCDYFWLLDDDSRPAPITLERCLGEAGTMPRFGIIGLSGGTIRWGVSTSTPNVPTPTVARPIRRCSTSATSSTSTGPWSPATLSTSSATHGPTTSGCSRTSSTRTG